MRKGMFIVAAATAVCLTGCVSVQTLTEDQNNAIAEYMADSLLKSDKNYTYNMKLDNDNYQEEPTATPQIQPTAVPKPTASPEIGSTMQPVTPLNSDNPTESSEPQQKLVSLSDAMNLSGFKAKVTGYKYDSAISTGVSDISAHKGKKLFVVNIKFKNTSGQNKKIDMTKNKSSYVLNVDGKDMDTPLLTIANEDIHFIKKTVAGGKSVNSILVFEIPSGTKLKNVLLEVTNKDMMAQVNIK